MRLCTSRIGFQCWVTLALFGLPAFAQESGSLQPGPVRFSPDEKGITVADERVTFRIGGRLQVDPATGGTRPDLDDPFGNHFEVRRAWAESYLTLDNSVELAFQYDFNSERRPINGAVVAYRGTGPVILTFGNFKEPFSLQQLMSNNDTTFVERALPDALVPARNVGLALGGHGERWTAAAGAFAGNINTGTATEGTAGTGRVTYAPILTDDRVLHLGISTSYRSYGRSDAGVKFETKPEAYVFQPALLDTGTIENATSLTRLGLEAAYQIGPVRVQGEYVLAEVDRGSKAPDAAFQGGYVEASWILNGPGRRYELAPNYGANFAVFKGVSVPESQRVGRGGLGLFELAGRFSMLDLNSGDVQGGVERNWTAGLNWYPETNMRLMANYIRAAANGSPVAPGRITADIVEFRLQVHW
jgi:phosphate-selective porin OprO/OprP